MELLRRYQIAAFQSVVAARQTSTEASRGPFLRTRGGMWNFPSEGSVLVNNLSVAGLNTAQIVQHIQSRLDCD